MCKSAGVYRQCFEERSAACTVVLAKIKQDGQAFSSPTKLATVLNSSVKPSRINPSVGSQAFITTFSKPLTCRIRRRLRSNILWLNLRRPSESHFLRMTCAPTSDSVNRGRGPRAWAPVLYILLPTTYLYKIIMKSSTSAFHLKVHSSCPSYGYPFILLSHSSCPSHGCPFILSSHKLPTGHCQKRNYEELHPTCAHRIIRSPAVRQCRLRR